VASVTGVAKIMSTNWGNFKNRFLTQRKGEKNTSPTVRGNPWHTGYKHEFRLQTTRTLWNALERGKVRTGLRDTQTQFLSQIISLLGVSVYTIHAVWRQTNRPHLPGAVLLLLCAASLSTDHSSSPSTTGSHMHHRPCPTAFIIPKTQLLQSIRGINM